METLKITECKKLVPRLGLACIFLALWVPQLQGDSFPLEAQVIAADLESRSLHLRYEGLMSDLPSGVPTDELKVAVGQGDALIGYVDRSIRGQLLNSEGRWRLERIWPATPDVERLMAKINRQLRRDTVTRGRKVFRSVGEYIPDFALYDQDGRMVTARQLRGKRIVLNFIFTRCMVPTMCPAATARMASLQREAHAAGVADLQLVTITFDPEYDTPGILKNYARTHALDTATFSLLTGPKRTIDDLMTQFGILTENEDGTIDHTMATLLIDARGRISYRREGSLWSADDFLERLLAPDLKTEDPLLTKQSE